MCEVFVDIRLHCCMWSWNGTTECCRGKGCCKTGATVNFGMQLVDAGWQAARV